MAATGDTPPAQGLGHGLAVVVLLAVLLPWLGLVGAVGWHAALPDQRHGTVLVLFRPNTPALAAINAVARADGVLVRDTWFDSVWFAHGDAPGFVARLKAEGALAAYEPVAFTPIGLGGCFAPIGALPERPKLPVIR